MSHNQAELNQSPRLPPGHITEHSRGVLSGRTPCCGADSLQTQRLCGGGFPEAVWARLRTRNRTRLEASCAVGSLSALDQKREPEGER